MSKLLTIKIVAFSFLMLIVFGCRPDSQNFEQGLQKVWKRVDAGMPPDDVEVDDEEPVYDMKDVADLFGSRDERGARL